MSKLADILFKPIGIVVSADKVQIVRPNGDKISCVKECISQNAFKEKEQAKNRKIILACL